MTNLTSEQYRDILHNIEGYTEKTPSVQHLVRRAVETFYDSFGCYPEAASAAPGCGAIFGEQTQFDQGIALALPTPMVTVVVGRKVPGCRVTVVTTADVGRPHKVCFKLSGCPLNASEPVWVNFIKGAMAIYCCTRTVTAFEAAIETSLPLGVGLGSAAALEIAVFTLLELLFGKRVSPVEKAIACQYVEEDFLERKVGLVSRICASTSKDRSVILIDLVNNDTDWVPVRNKRVVFVAIDSHLRDTLFGEEYSSRAKYFNKACDILGIESLRKMNVEDLDILEARIKGKDSQEEEEIEEETLIDDEWTEEKLEKVLKYARFYVMEMKRIQEATEALKEGDFEAFGQSMTESHYSLKEDLEFYNPVLEFFVKTSVETEGVYGSKMIGLGLDEGGCVLTLIVKENLQQLCENISASFLEHRDEIMRQLKEHLTKNLNGLSQGEQGAQGNEDGQGGKEQQGEQGAKGNEDGRGGKEQQGQQGAKGNGDVRGSKEQQREQGAKGNKDGRGGKEQQGENTEMEDGKISFQYGAAEGTWPAGEEGITVKKKKKCDPSKKRKKRMEKDKLLRLKREEEEEEEEEEKEEDEDEIRKGAAGKLEDEQRELEKMGMEGRQEGNGKEVPFGMIDGMITVEEMSDENKKKGEAEDEEMSLAMPSFYIINPIAGARMIFPLKTDLLRSLYARRIPQPKELVKNAANKLYELFEYRPQAIGLAPATTTLFGEFLEHNMGYVINMALPLLTVTLGSKNSTTVFHMSTSSKEVGECTEFSSPVPLVGKTNIQPNTWMDEAVRTVTEFGGGVPGFAAVVESSVPCKIGIHSCSAFHGSIYTFLEGLTGTCTKDFLEKVERCLRATLINSPDPFLCRHSTINFISTFLCRESYVLLINSKNLKMVNYYLDHPSYAFLLACCKERSSTVTVNSIEEKLQTCKEAAEIIGKDSLINADERHIRCLRKRGASEDMIKRVQYIITEQQRCVKAIEAIKLDDYVNLGALMTQSHCSLRDDFEVSSPEMEVIVNLALSVEGVLGAKLVGMGLSSTVLILATLSSVDQCIKYVRKNYTQKSDKPFFYVFRPSSGAYEMDTEESVLIP